jgi:hypothetical protein
LVQEFLKVNEVEKSVKERAMRRLLSALAVLAFVAFGSAATQSPGAHNSNPVPSITLIEDVHAQGAVTTTANTAFNAVAVKADEISLHGVRRLHLIQSYHSGGLLKAVDTATGTTAFESSKPVNAWVLRFSGSAPAGYGSLVGVAVVDANSGRIMAITMRAGPPPTIARHA